MINVFQPTVGSEELTAVKRVFASDWLGRGKECELFEAEFAEYLGTDKSQVLLFNSCTAALYIGLRTLDIGPGDEVIIPTIHHVSAMNAILELGATPVLADVYPRTLNIKPTDIHYLKTPKTKAVILLHYGGHPCYMEAVKAACNNDMLIIEDAANAVASTHKGIACGILGDMGVWSFDAMKIATMGDGGMLWLRNPEDVERAKSLRYLGLEQTSGQESLESGKERWWEYNVSEPSNRYISNDILAAIGRVQLKRLPGFINRRRRIWRTYQKRLKHLPVQRPPEPPPGCESSYYLYWIQTNHRDELAQYLAKHDIYTTFKYYPLHRAFRNKLDLHEVVFNGLSGALQAELEVLNLPIHQSLTTEDIYYICDCIDRFFKRRK